MDFEGEFETHFTVQTTRTEQVDSLREWGAARGLKCVHIVLSSGSHSSQPMLTGHGRGVLPEQMAAAKQTARDLEAAGFPVTRIKIEAAPGNEDIPRTPEEALAQPPGRYFEHHVKLLMDAEERSMGVYLRESVLAAYVSKHGARLSRNFRRVREDGRSERFVTQRCFGVDQAEAQRQLGALLDELKALCSPASGEPEYVQRLRTRFRDIQPFGFEILESEEEFVVYDSNLDLDAGWFEEQTLSVPSTQIPAAENHKRAEIFEPALKHFARAFRKGDPQFANESDLRAWQDTRKRVAGHLLGLVAGSPWSEQLVLRGSLLLQMWLGEAAREPGDIDWVFRPSIVGDKADGLLSRQLFDELRQLGTRNPSIGEATIEVGKIAVDDIWTYDRVPGRRIVFPWSAPGLPPGEVQMDVVFGEDLFTEPTQVLVESPGGEAGIVWTAGKEVSLAWKLMWLEMDFYPQGKDLYDATLLAEHLLSQGEHLPLGLLHRVMESSAEWRAGTILQPDFPALWRVDWDNFKLEYPSVPGEASEWQARLTRALGPTFAGG